MTFMPTCREVQTELTDYVEGALPFRRRAGIWLHLLLCRVCAGFLRGLKALPGLSKVLLTPSKATPPAASEALAAAQTAIQAALAKSPKP